MAMEIKVAGQMSSIDVIENELMLSVNSPLYSEKEDLAVGIVSLYEQRSGAMIPLKV